MTLKEVLQETNRILEGVSVPVNLIRQVGVPIMSAMENLQKCIDAIPDPTPEELEEKAIHEEDI